MPRPTSRPRLTSPRRCVASCRYRGVCVDQTQRKPLAGQVVLNALRYERTTVLLRAIANFISVQPQCSQDAVIERLIFRSIDGADERKAHIRHRLTAIGGT